MGREAISAITFVTREGCSVCDEALARLAGPARRLRVEIDAVDVDQDRDLSARFGDRVPVVLAPDGTVLAEGRISALAAASAVWRARRSRT